MGNNDLEAYLLKHTSPEDDVLYELGRHTHLTGIHPRMLTGPIQGKFLELICRMLKPMKVLEIGTYTGYSAICMAKALPQHARLHTIEINDEVCETAHDFFQKSGINHLITLHQGDALEIIPQLNEEFDLVHIDGDKRQYPEYLNLVVPKVKPGGFIVADNVLWGEKVLLEKPDDAYTKGVKEFNKMVAEDERLEKVLLPIRDGLYVIYKRP